MGGYSNGIREKKDNISLIDLVYRSDFKECKWKFDSTNCIDILMALVFNGVRA